MNCNPNKVGVELSKRFQKFCFAIRSKRHVYQTNLDVGQTPPEFAGDTEQAAWKILKEVSFDRPAFVARVDEKDTSLHGFCGVIPTTEGALRAKDGPHEYSRCLGLTL